MQSFAYNLKQLDFGSLFNEMELGNSKWCRDNIYMIVMKLKNYVECHIAQESVGDWEKWRQTEKDFDISALISILQVSKLKLRKFRDWFVHESRHPLNSKNLFSEIQQPDLEMFLNS